jgi:cytochrome P450
MNSWAVHRRKETWGEDAEVFRPERWLEANEEKKMEMERAMLHFGAGSHVCIGRWISMVEIWKFLPVFLGKFEVRTSTTRRENDVC